MSELWKQSRFTPKEFAFFSRSNTNLMQRRNSEGVLLNVQNAERNSYLMLSLDQQLRTESVVCLAEKVNAIRDGLSQSLETLGKK